jgi:hypothetical protein
MDVFQNILGSNWEEFEQQLESVGEKDTASINYHPIEDSGILGGDYEINVRVDPKEGETLSYEEEVGSHLPWKEADVESRVDYLESKLSEYVEDQSVWTEDLSPQYRTQTPAAKLAD